MVNINFIHIPKNGGTFIKQFCFRNKSASLIYNGHLTDVYNKNLSNQLVIIRNPIDRFISAVYYAIQKWSQAPQIKYLISKNIDTPEKWVQIWSDPKHSDHDNLMSEMINKDHFIGNKLYKYKWTYSPQSLWINNPKFVIIMDNLNDEFQYFCKKYKIETTLKKEKLNSTYHSDDKLSIESINFLRNFYKGDFILYEKYKQMSIAERI
jgi:hypothetical protein